MSLATLAGLDRRSGELLGWGAMHAELARATAAMRGASWWFVLTGPDGAPSQIGPIRRRPTGWQTTTGPAEHLEVWLPVTDGQLAWLTDNPPPGWQALIDHLNGHIASAASRPPNRDPTARLPGAPLRRWIAIRDRQCTFPGCRVPAHVCQPDHILEHSYGGPTTDRNLGAACGADHPLRHDGGWRVHQPAPGQVIWTSPLGHSYQNLAIPPPLAPMTDPITPDEDPSPTRTMTTATPTTDAHTSNRDLNPHDRRLYHPRHHHQPRHCPRSRRSSVNPETRVRD